MNLRLYFLVGFFSCLQLSYAQIDLDEVIIIDSVPMAWLLSDATDIEGNYYLLCTDVDPDISTSSNETLYLVKYNEDNNIQWFQTISAYLAGRLSSLTPKIALNYDVLYLIYESENKSYLNSYSLEGILQYSNEYLQSFNNIKVLDNNHIVLHKEYFQPEPYHPTYLLMLDKTGNTIFQYDVPNTGAKPGYLYLDTENNLIFILDFYEYLEYAGHIVSTHVSKTLNKISPQGVLLWETEIEDLEFNIRYIISDHNYNIFLYFGNFLSKYSESGVLIQKQYFLHSDAFLNGLQYFPCNGILGVGYDFSTDQSVNVWFDYVDMSLVDTIMYSQVMSSNRSLSDVIFYNNGASTCLHNILFKSTYLYGFNSEGNQQFVEYLIPQSNEKIEFANPKHFGIKKGTIFLFYSARELDPYLLYRKICNNETSNENSLNYCTEILPCNSFDIRYDPNSKIITTSFGLQSEILINYTIYDIQGRLILTKEIKGDLSENVEMLSKGSYVVTALINTTTICSKVVIVY